MAPAFPLGVAENQKRGGTQIQPNRPGARLMVDAGKDRQALFGGNPGKAIQCLGWRQAACHRNHSFGHHVTRENPLSVQNCKGRSRSRAMTVRYNICR